MFTDNLYIGLMSGTSMDGVDAVMVDFGAGGYRVLATHYAPYPADLKHALLAMVDRREQAKLVDLGEMDVQLGHFYAETALSLLNKTALEPASVTAIGSHGQTVFHRPPGSSADGFPFTMQIGDPNIIACKTRITTVADFRRRDMAAGGQGAPLVPAFHAAFFQTPAEDRVVLNIGGIANITILSAKGPVTGFDTGPGNTLLDQWVKRYLDMEFDTGGKAAATGKPIAMLLEQLAGDDYFKRSPPKSTGREYFNLTWLEPFLAGYAQYSPTDVLASLTELTAGSIVNAIRDYAPQTRRVYICGGGVHNTSLVNRLGQLLPDIALESTAAMGMDPDYVEATAFAWLARQTLERRPGNVPEVTDAEEPVILGGVYYA